MAAVVVYDRPVPARASSRIRTAGPLLILRLALLVLVELDSYDLVEVGDDAVTYSPSTYWASLKKVVRFSRRV